MEYKKDCKEKEEGGMKERTNWNAEKGIIKKGKQI